MKSREETLREELTAAVSGMTEIELERLLDFIARMDENNSETEVEK